MRFVETFYILDRHFFRTSLTRLLRCKPQYLSLTEKSNTTMKRFTMIPLNQLFSEFSTSGQINWMTTTNSTHTNCYTPLVRLKTDLANDFFLIRFFQCLILPRFPWYLDTKPNKLVLLGFDPLLMWIVHCQKLIFVHLCYRLYPSESNSVLSDSTTTL